MLNIMKKSTSTHSPICTHRYIDVAKSKRRCHYYAAHHISHFGSHQVGAPFSSRSSLPHFPMCNFQNFHAIDCDIHWVTQMTNFGPLCNTHACDKVMRFYAPSYTTYCYWPPTNFGEILRSLLKPIALMVMPSASLIFHTLSPPMPTAHMGAINAPIPHLHLHYTSPIFNPKTKSVIPNNYFCPATCRYKCTTNSP